MVGLPVQLQSQLHLAAGVVNCAGNLPETAPIECGIRRAEPGVIERVVGLRPELYSHSFTEHRQGEILEQRQVDGLLHWRPAASIRAWSRAQRERSRHAQDIWIRKVLRHYVRAGAMEVSADVWLLPTVSRQTLAARKPQNQWSAIGVAPDAVRSGR